MNNLTWPWTFIQIVDQYALFDQKLSYKPVWVHVLQYRNRRDKKIL